MSEDVSNRTELPEYRPACFRNLNGVLGRSDATVEWVEVAVRHLKHEHDNGGPERASRLAAQYGVRVNPIDFEHVSTRWTCLQILSVYQCGEWFLDEFRREHPRQVRTRNSDEDLLSYTLAAFNIGKADVGTLEFEVLDYYRLVRNHLMHKPLEAQARSHMAQSDRIRGIVSGSTYQSLAAPNHLGLLSFDDFVLFSRALKHVARKLCTFAQPTDIELFESVYQDHGIIRMFRANKQNEERVAAKIAAYLRTQYGLPNTAAKVSRTILSLLAQR